MVKKKDHENHQEAGSTVFSFRGLWAPETCGLREQSRSFSWDSVTDAEAGVGLLETGPCVAQSGCHSALLSMVSTVPVGRAPGQLPPLRSEQD